MWGTRLLTYTDILALHGRVHAWCEFDFAHNGLSLLEFNPLSPHDRCSPTIFIPFYYIYLHDMDMLMQQYTFNQQIQQKAVVFTVATGKFIEATGSDMPISDRFVNGKRQTTTGT